MEFRGFDYHEGISFSIFAKGLRTELGRGGRYLVDDNKATGFTLYVTHLLRFLPEPKERKLLMLSADISGEAAAKLRAEGWTTLYALTSKMREEAKCLGCKHIMEKGTIEAV
jgi:ATP phosphoribosyltransferase regulatory subunit